MVRESRTRTRNAHLLSDLGLIVLSALVALILAQTHVLTDILSVTPELQLFGTFVAGMFFTSIFTTAPASATLGEFALTQPLLLTALVGSLGSVLGDLLIFRFIRDRFAADLMELLKERKGLRRLQKIFRFKHFRWFTFFLGGLVIASPLPDEIGIALLGVSHVNMKWFVAISFVFNFIGIVLIGMTARSFSSGAF